MPVGIPLALQSRSIIMITMGNIFNDSENVYRWDFYLVKIYNFTHTMYRYCFYCVHFPSNTRKQIQLSR